jgi:hypothetical protein
VRRYCVHTFLAIDDAGWERNFPGAAFHPRAVIPAQAGIHPYSAPPWIPAFAGMTEVREAATFFHSLRSRAKVTNSQDFAFSRPKAKKFRVH